MSDHIHMLVSIPPKLRVAQFRGYFKGKSSLMIFDRHANLKYKYGNRQFWCKGYYVYTVVRNKKVIQEYIKNQIQEDIVYEQMSLKEYMRKDVFTKDHSNCIKGIAIIAMLFHHLFLLGRYDGYSVNFVPFSQEYISDFAWQLKNCISLFAFISGFGLCMSIRKINQDYVLDKKELYSWYIKRIINLLSGYCFVVILSWIVCQIIDGRVVSTYFTNGFIFGVNQMIFDLFGVSNLFGTVLFHTTWWYISAAIVYVFLTPFLCRALKKYGALPFVFGIIAIFKIAIGFRDITTFLFIFSLGIIFSEYNLFEKFINQPNIVY